MLNELAQLTPCTLPEPTGERHRFTSKAAVLAFYEQFQGWDTYELVLRMAPDRSFVVDVTMSESNSPAPAESRSL